MLYLEWNRGITSSLYLYRDDFLLYRKFLLNHELCKQIALQKQGTENRRLRLEDIKTFFSKIVIVDIIKFM